MIKIWKDNGEHIILGGDINVDVNDIYAVKRFNENRLYNTFKELHDWSPESYKYYIKNKTIDGIQATLGVQPVKAGLTAYMDWDHCIL